MDPTDLINYANAIKSVESSGGNYGAIGPVTRSGDRAYGAYQVMGNNIPDWTEKHYGRRMTPADFLKNREAQDAVFNGEFGSYVNKYGNPQDAASVWFSGRPMAKAGNADDGYITTPEYVNRFNKALSPTGDDPVAAVNKVAGVQPRSASTGGALAFSGDPADNAEDTSDDKGVLAKANGDGTLYQGEPKNKLHSLGAMLTNIAASLSSINNPAQAQALQKQAEGIEAKAGSNYQYMMGSNGQLVRIDKRDGTVTSREIPGAAKAGNFHVIPDKNTGMPLGTINGDTGEIKMFKQGAGGADEGVPLGGDPELTGDERYASLDKQTKNYVDQWEDGKLGAPSAWQLKHDPIVKAAYQAAQAVGVDFTKFPERKRFAEGYASKNAASMGGQLLRSSTALKQVGDMGQNYLDLHNSAGLNPEGFGSGVTSNITNWAKNNLSGGAARDTLINNLNNNAQTTSNEVQTVLSQGRGTETDRSKREQTYLKPNASPLVHAGILQTEMDQLTNRYNDAVAAAKSTMGQRWLDRHPEIEAEYQKQTARIRGMINTLQARAHGTAKEEAKPAANAPALPKGVTSIQVIQPQQ